MRLKGVIAEDFVNYKKPSMFLITCFCDFKCCTEAGVDKTICQNEPLYDHDSADMAVGSIYDSYISNDITKAVCIGGMEPILQVDELIEVLDYFRRRGCDDEFVIYTGYYPEEIQDEIERLVRFKNVIVKFGRYIPGRRDRFDDILGIRLASDNQYAARIS